MFINEISLDDNFYFNPPEAGDPPGEKSSEGGDGNAMTRASSLYSLIYSLGIFEAAEPPYY